MILNFRKLLIVMSVIIASAISNTLIAQKRNTEKSASNLFPVGEKLSNEWFAGEAYLFPLQKRDKNNDFSIGNVIFETNARSNWHKHPKGQILIVTEGEGLYQEMGEKAQIIRKGDVINIPENVAHWHGATNHSRMVHIAITNYHNDTNAIWLNPVTDDEFALANQ